TKREPQKVKLLVRVSLSPIGILAVDHFRLLWMQFQSTLLQPCRYLGTHQVRFPLCSAMDDDVVRIPLERQMKPTPSHPQIERVVQKQISQQSADDTALRRATFTLPPMSLFMLRRRFQPRPDPECDPPVFGVLLFCPDHRDVTQ